MKGITTDLYLRPYLREWVTHIFGTPVRFPARSCENALLVRGLVKRTGQPVRADGEAVLVVIPDNASRRPEYFNALSPRAQKQLAASLENLFRIHLWTECFALLTSPNQLNAGLDAWCAHNGISLDHRGGVLKKFYRMRLDYQAKGIPLKKIRKSLSL